MAVQEFDFASGKVRNPKRNLSLILSDDKENSESLVRLLRERSVRVLVNSADMAEVLASVRSNKAGVLYLDSDMSGLDANALMQKVKSAFPDFRVVLMSAVVNKEAVTKAMGLGADGFLVKPLDANAMVNLLARLNK